MISSVTFEKSTWNVLPYKFEAGTPNIAGTIALGAAIDYVRTLGMEAIASHEDDLLAYATERVSAIPGVRLIGTAREKAAVLSFTVDGVHPHDIGTVLDRAGIAVRTGHHCAQPVMDFFRVPATARASFGLYNTREEVDAARRRDRGSPEDVRMSGGGDLRDLYQEVILDHGKRPRNFRKLAGREPAGGGIQPALRRPRDGLPRARRRRRPRRVLRGSRLRDLDGVGFDDDRES